MEDPDESYLILMAVSSGDSGEGVFRNACQSLATSVFGLMTLSCDALPLLPLVQAVHVHFGGVSVDTLAI